MTIFYNKPKPTLCQSKGLLRHSEVDDNIGFLAAALEQPYYLSALESRLILGRGQSPQEYQHQAETEFSLDQFGLFSATVAV